MAELAVMDCEVYYDLYGATELGRTLLKLNNCVRKMTPRTAFDSGLRGWNGMRKRVIHDEM